MWLMASSQRRGYIGCCNVGASHRQRCVKRVYNSDTAQRWIPPVRHQVLDLKWYVIQCLWCRETEVT